MLEFLAAIWLTTVVSTLVVFVFLVMRHTTAVLVSLRRIHDLHGDVERLRVSHDHYVAATDRRLKSVETAAAEAAHEARLVSVQVAEVAEMLDEQRSIFRGMWPAHSQGHGPHGLGRDAGPQG